LYFFEKEKSISLSSGPAPFLQPGLYPHPAHSRTNTRTRTGPRPLAQDVLGRVLAGGRRRSGHGEDDHPRRLWQNSDEQHHSDTFANLPSLTDGRKQTPPELHKDMADGGDGHAGKTVFRR
jgi:hypothetical protein